MAKQQPVALVFAGPVSRGSLGRLPGLRQQLAWIKSSSIPTASRAVHALGCGRAVARFSDLRSAELFVISAPVGSVAEIVENLADSGLSWHERIVVLYDSGCDSSALTPLRELGAETASIFYHARPEQFLGEGTPEALRGVRKLTGDKTLISLRSYDEYQRGLCVTTEEFFPMLEAAMDAFTRAGMSRPQAEQTTAVMIAESARNWLRAGKRLLAKRAAKP